MVVILPSNPRCPENGLVAVRAFCSRGPRLAETKPRAFARKRLPGMLFAFVYFMACQTPAHKDDARANATSAPQTRPTQREPHSRELSLDLPVQPHAHRDDRTDEQRVYLRLRDSTVHTDIPQGLYIVGTQSEDGYYPQGAQVEGDGPLGATEGTPGWLELLDLRFYPAMTSRAPARPYVEGTRSDDGFVPSSRQIVY